MPVVDAVKKELVKGGKCPSSEFVPERERDRLRSDTASKVTSVLASYSSHVPKGAADIITGDASCCAPFNTNCRSCPRRAHHRPLLGVDADWGAAVLPHLRCHRRRCPSLCRARSQNDCFVHMQRSKLAADHGTGSDQRCLEHVLAARVFYAPG